MSGKTSKATIRITGMHCNSCAALIKDILEEQDGVMNADVSYEKGTASVQYDATRITEGQLKSIIKKEGYVV